MPKPESRGESPGIYSTGRNVAQGYNTNELPDVLPQRLDISKLTGWRTRAPGIWLEAYVLILIIQNQKRYMQDSYNKYRGFCAPIAVFYSSCPLLLLIIPV
jgi:hypothetical protein